MTNGDRPGTTHTFYSMRGFHMVTGIVGAVIGVGFVVLGSVASTHPHVHFFQADGGESNSSIYGSIFLGALLAWICIRMIRVGVRISAEKITVRGYFRTRTVEASEIRAISLQPAAGQSGSRWLPRVELAGGRSFWIYSFDCGPVSKPPKPGKDATIQKVRALLGVEPPDLGDQPGLTHEDESERSRSLRADPASGTEVV